ncbi:MAG: hypothetical protein JXA21_23755 [Anaerolineae bacterium]|nr:hypothetical protein [Anaerolineae bacterium]
MTVVLAWLSQQAFFIYAICLIGAIGYLMTAISARRRRDVSQFSLEREVHQQRMSRAGVMATLSLTLGGLVFIIRTFVLPPLPVITTPTPTLGVGLRTPVPRTATPTTALTSTTAISSVVISAPTPVANQTPDASPTPAQEAILPDCPNPEAQITSPVAGSKLSGQVAIYGTAKVNSFSYYKFEVRFPGSDTPNFISQYTQSVENEYLGSWDVSDAARFPPGGIYYFQLVVVDLYGNTTTCSVPVEIVVPEN